MDVADVKTSSRNTLIVFKTEDGYNVETVYTKKNKSICVSTQVGCNIGCRFCASSKNGFIRNMSGEEILHQINYVCEEISADIGCVHFAGIGEPVLNIDSIESKLKVLLSCCENIHLTTSAPVISGIKRLLDLPISRLFVSMHSFIPETRKYLMPNSQSPNIIVNELYRCLDENPKLKGRVYLSYVILSGVNDSDEEVDKLVSCASYLDLPVFLMVYNKIAKESLFETSLESIDKIKKKLEVNNIKYSISGPSRADKVGGCGTLRLNRNI